MLKYEIDHVLFCAGDTTQFKQFGNISFDEQQYLSDFERFIFISSQIPTLKSFTFISSAGALYATGQYVNEKSKVSISTPYANIKFKMEEILIRALLGGNIAHRILRVTNLYGPTQLGKVRGGFLNELIASSISGKTFNLDSNYQNVSKNFVYIKDLIYILNCIIKNYANKNLLVNVASDISYRLDEVLELTQNILQGFNLNIEVLKKNFQYIGNSNQQFDLTLLKTIIPEYKSTSLSDGILQTINEIY